MTIALNLPRETETAHIPTFKDSFSIRRFRVRLFRIVLYLGSSMAKVEHRRFPLFLNYLLVVVGVRSLDRNDWMVSDRMCDVAAEQDGWRQ